jgi:hypothetical protein
MMQSIRKRLAVLAVLLTLAAGLMLAAGLTRAQQEDTHHPTPPPATYNENGNENDRGRVGIPYNRACQRRCNQRYRVCLRSGQKANACRQQLRNCLRRCPQ